MQPGVGAQCLKHVEHRLRADFERDDRDLGFWKERDGCGQPVAKGLSGARRSARDRGHGAAEPLRCTLEDVRLTRSRNDSLAVPPRPEAAVVVDDRYFARTAETVLQNPRLRLARPGWACAAEEDAV